MCKPSVFVCCSIIGDGILQLSRSDAFSRDSGLCIDHLHRLSCHVVDLPPLPSLPAPLLLQNFPSLLTARVLSPQAGSAVLDCCAAPGNKWTHLAMIMGDDGVVVSVPAGMRRSWGWTAV